MLFPFIKCQPVFYYAYMKLYLSILIAEERNSTQLYIAFYMSFPFLMKPLLNYAHMKLYLGILISRKKEIHTTIDQTMDITFLGRTMDHQ
jgi:hypothetical protein